MTALTQTIVVSKLMCGADPDLARQVVAIVRDLETERNDLQLELHAVRLGRNLVLDANVELLAENSLLQARVKGGVA